MRCRTVGVALGRVRIADREQAAGHRDRIVHSAPCRRAIVHVAAKVARRNRIHIVRLLRRHAMTPKWGRIGMRTFLRTP